MQGVILPTINYQLPTIVDETEDFAVVFKPPRMHCAPLQTRPSDTLLDWYTTIFPSVMELSGRKEGEGGLLHRLDYETQGLVLFAKNQKALDSLLALQDAGGFIKEYSAICQKATPHRPLSLLKQTCLSCNSDHHLGSQRADPKQETQLDAVPSFVAPLPPEKSTRTSERVDEQSQNGVGQVKAIVIEKSKGPPTPHYSFPTPPFDVSSVYEGCVIESYFRPFGPGRKQVRPVTQGQGALYRTEIAAFSQPVSDHFAFTIRLRRGFRHQVRCHLAWIGCPVLNDPLYGTNADGGFLALRASGLIFTDPISGKPRKYRIAPLEIP